MRAKREMQHMVGALTPKSPGCPRVHFYVMPLGCRQHSFAQRGPTDQTNVGHDGKSKKKSYTLNFIMLKNAFILV